MAFDPATATPDAPFDPSTATPTRSTLGEIGAGLKRGLYQGVAGAGSILQTPAERGKMEPGIVSRAGHAMEEFGKKGAQENAPQAGHGVVTDTLAQVAEAPGAALPVLAGAIGGGMAGSVLPGPGNLIGAAVGGGAAAGLQSWHEKYQEGKEKGLDDAKARARADTDAGISAAGMGAVSAIPVVGPMARAALKPAKTVLEAGADVVGKKFLPQFGKGSAEMVAGNVAQGVGQAAAEAKVDEGYGVATQTPWEAAKAAAMPSLIGSVGFLPLSALHAKGEAGQAKKFQAALTDGDAMPLSRMRAAEAVYAGMKKADPNQATMWRINALEAIKQKKTIGLDDSWLKPNGHPSLFPQAHEPDAGAVMEGEGGGQQQGVPLQPEAPVDTSTFEGEGGGQAQGVDRNRIEPTAGASTATMDGTSPFPLTTDHARQNATDANEALWAARDAHEAALQKIASTGAFGQAAASGIRSGLVEQKAGERAAEAEQSKAPGATKDGEEADPHVSAWLSGVPPQSLPEAQALAAQFSQTRPYSVVPHPEGQGYGVIPTELLHETLQGEHGGIQKASSEAPTDTTRMPYNDKAAADKVAAEMTAQHGREYESVPSPHAREKFVVQPKAEPEHVQKEEPFTEREQAPAAEQAAPVEEVKQPASPEAVKEQVSVAHHITRLLVQPSAEAREHANAVDATPAEHVQIARAMQELPAKSIDRLGTLSNVHVHADEADGSYYSKTQSVGLGRALLEQLAADKENGHLRLAEAIDHEIWHHSDHKGEGEFHSMDSPLFAIEPAEHRMDRKATGPVIREALDHFNNFGRFSKLLAYPLDDFRAHTTDQEQHLAVIKAEVFAQLGRMYNSVPFAMAKELPVAYKLFKDIHDTAAKQHLSIPDATARVFGEAVSAGGASVRKDGRLDIAQGKSGGSVSARDGGRDKRAPVVPADLRGDGRGFTKFFSGATKGERNPNTGKAYEPVLDIGHAKSFSAEYAKHRGNFDDHIATSIPGFREVQQSVGNAIVKALPEGGRVLDIGASEGSFIKAITAVSGGKIKTVGMDPNPAMADFFKKHSVVPGSSYDMSAFSAKADEGKPAWKEDDGTEIKNYKPDGKFDVVHEAMVFQFIGDSREGQVARVKEMLKTGGVAMFEQKFTPDKKTFDANEAKKDAFKAQYYSEAELARKKADVLERGEKAVAAEDKAKEEKIVGMHNLMVSPEAFEKVLSDNFDHVVQYWDSGNFKGYAVSDDPVKLAQVTAHISTLKSDFRTVETPRQVKGPVAGEHTVNIGLHTNDGKMLTKPEVRAALKAAGVKITRESLVKSNSEPTLVASLDRPLSPAEAHQVSVALRQEAIAQRSNGKGELYGPDAEKWKPFNKDYFQNHPIASDTAAINFRDGVKPEGLKKSPNVDEVGLYFNDLVAKENDGKPRDYTNQKDIDLAAKQGSNEFAYQLKTEKSGLDWYSGDIKEAWEQSALVHPELGTSELKRQLSSIITGLLSPDVKAHENWRFGMEAYGHYAKTGEIPVVNPSNGVLWPGYGMIKRLAFTHVNAMIKDIGEAKTVEWLLSPHTVKELNAMRSKYGVYKPGNVVSGKATEMKWGVHMFGPKVGPFVMNLNGIDATTVDKWATRTIRRWFGTGVAGKDVAPSEQERAVFTQIAAKIGAEHGFRPQEVQSVLWFFEQQVYNEVGAGSKSHTFSEGAKNYVELNGPEAGAVREHALGHEAEAGAGPEGLADAAREAGQQEAAYPLSVHDEDGRPLFLRGDGKRASARELAAKVTTGNAAEHEQQFNKSGDPLTEAKPDPEMPVWLSSKDTAAQEFARKAGMYVPKQTWREKWAELKKDMGLKIIQASVDQYAPVLKNISKYSYQLLRMASSSGNGLAAMVEAGHVHINNWGALAVTPGTKSLRAIMSPLKGEHERFMAWMAANRANLLIKEDREHNFTPEEIAAGMKFNAHDDTWKGEGTRTMAYAAAAKEFSAMNRSVLDVAEKAGVIDPEARKLFESEWYVPFFREKEDGTQEVNPSNISGMVNAKGIKRLKGGENVLHDLLANTMQNWSSLLSSAMKNNAAWHTLEEAEGLGIAHRVKSDEKGSVYVLQDGKEVHWMIDDHLVSQAVSSLSAVPFRGPVMKALTKFKHVLTSGVTLSPTFRVNNVIRDQIASLSSNQVSYNFTKNLVDGFKYSSRNNPEFGNMLAGGAFIEMGQTLGDNRGAYVKRLIEEGIDKGSILDSDHKVKAAFGHAWDWWQETGNRSERLTRANLYRQTFERMTKEGMDPERAHFEASYVAKDSMDFTLHGTSSAIRMVTQVVPFLNARMQGLYKLQRGAKEDPKRFAAVIGGVTLATIALTLAARDDEDMQKRSEWDRDNFWAFRMGDKIMRAPKPFEVGALATVIDRGLEAALDGLDAPARERFIARLWPIIGNQLNANPVPQAVAPLIQLWGNKSWFTDQNIESQRDANLTTSQRIGPNTSATAQLLGKAEVMSPEQIDFMVNAYLGWAGNHAIATADLALRPAMGLPEKASRRVDDYFMIGDFVKQLPSNQSRFTEQYYDHLKDVQQAMGDIRMLQQTGQMERAAEAMKANKDIVGLEKMYTRTSREIGKINQRMRWTSMRGEPTPENPNGMTADQKREELDRLTQLKNRLTATAETSRATAMRSQ